MNALIQEVAEQIAEARQLDIQIKEQPAKVGFKI